MAVTRMALVDASSAAEIGRLATCLTQEIIERTGVRHFDVDEARAIALCREFLTQGCYQVMAAFEGERVLGFGALCESCSLYAEGRFGIIQEFYVLPEWRSHGVGEALLREITALGRAQGWTRLELCTPPLPVFERTVAFYQRNGFARVGGYKMKFALD